METRASFRAEATAAAYAGGLLADLPVRAGRLGAPDASALEEWAASGAMALTGEPGGPPRPAPAALALAARGAQRALEQLTGRASLDGPLRLAERAAWQGLSRHGAVSAGGSCRLLRARDGFVAVNAARADDRSLWPAWLEAPGELCDFDALAESMRSRDVAPIVARGVGMGLPVAAVVAPPARAPAWVRIESLAAPSPPAITAKPRVLDLTSLWAGPLCTRLLAHAGARVTKLESVSRPDGARAEPRFHTPMNRGKRFVALDLPRQLDALRAEIAAADIVVESARPRALRHWGLWAEECVRAQSGLSWVSVTGYGRSEPEAQWVAFGDDAAVAAGLAQVAGSEAAPLFCADAIADPLAGLHAAVAAWASFRAGGGRLISLSLRDVAGHAFVAGGGFAAARNARVRRLRGGSGDAFEVETASGWRPVRTPTRALAAERETKRAC